MKEKTVEKPTALSAELCPCQSGESYAHCCAPLHQGAQKAKTAEQLMRSRYAAYALQLVDYIIETTVPSQQSLLDKAALQQWAENTKWVGLEIVSYHPRVGKTQSAVEFKAIFEVDGEKRVHHEKSLFVHTDGYWFFVDPTVPLPAMKQLCVCGSGKKFKHCCGGLL